MRRRVVALAACTAAALGVFLPAGTSGPVPSLDATASTVESPRIQIRHELVRIPVTEVNTVTAEPGARPEPPTRGTAHAEAASGRRLLRVDERRAGSHGENRGLVQRAVRTIVGDGRHKPQPFPTPPR